jgi:MFS family permease
MPDLSKRQLRLGLLLVTIAHWCILGLYLFDVIPQQFHNPDSVFWLHHGGDDYGYVSLAQDISQLKFEAPNKYPIGFPILLQPFVAAVGTNHDDLLPVVALFWGAIMFPVGQWILAWIAERLLGKRWLALLAVGIWTSLPLVFYAVLRLVSNASVAETYSVHLTWFQMLSDGPGTLFTLLAVAVWLHLRTRSQPLYWSLLLGGLVGFLILIRLTGALMLGVIGFLLLYERRWRELVLILLAAFVVTTPQLFYNWHFFDNPFSTGYTTLDEVPPDNLFNLKYLVDGLRDLGRQRQIMVGIALILVVGISGPLLIAFSRRERLYALTLVLWAGSYVALYSIYYYSWTGGVARFLMPAYPAAAVLAAAMVDVLMRCLGRRWPPGRSRAF